MLLSLLPPDFFEVYNGLGYGGEGGLSIGLALFPELCQPEHARGIVPQIPPNLDVMWRFSELTRSHKSNAGERTSHERNDGQSNNPVITKPRCLRLGLPFTRSKTALKVHNSIFYMHNSCGHSSRLYS
jgi:hypothetical protein